MPPLDFDSPEHALRVYRGDQFCVRDGANLGDGLAIAEEIMLDDCYALEPDATLTRLTIQSVDNGRYSVGPGSEAGKPGHPLHLDCALTLMSPDGTTTEAIVLVEANKKGKLNAVYLLPLAPMEPTTLYAVVGIDINLARTKFAQVACVSFTRGTHITMASGEQVPVQNLRPGDRVLTRDDGAQKIRWIGQNTVRAVGAFAPIKIMAQTLNNERDLIVSPDHRLFVYQRTDALGTGRPEVLVKARHLVNGTTIQVQNGGFIDYFQLLFDRHQIIYAEGIAAESMLIDSLTRPALPKDLSEKLGHTIPGHTDRPHRGLDVARALLEGRNAAEILRRSSSS